MQGIQSKQNPRVKAWRKLQVAKHRRKQGRYLVEGDHLIEEALEHDAMIETILYAQGYEGDLLDRIMATSIESIEVSQEVLEELAMTETPQGLIAVIKIKEERLEDIKGQRFLVCDAIQDPGNLGTIIRTADAAGWDGILLTTGCVDFYNDKVLRAGQGSHWHLPILTASPEDIYSFLKKLGLAIYVTALHQAALSYQDVSLSPGAIVVGNEGQGVSSFWLEKGDQAIYIPMPGQAESLNVAIAAGILLFH